MATAYFGGSPVTGSRGPSGPDGNPVGTIISFMGVRAPAGYLVCDGSNYPITEYPDLAQFFVQEFGSASYFGGDGINTFSIPDMRNLFLRGYCGDAEEQLSGEVGIKQDGTSHIGVGVWNSGDGGSSNALFQAGKSGMSIFPTNMDTSVMNAWVVDGPNMAVFQSSPRPQSYTSRPVNMAVLYCIKAVLSVPTITEYDTEDGWHVRKYSDGYIEMNCVKTLTVDESTWIQDGSIYTIPSVVFDYVPYPVQLIDVYFTSIEPKQGKLGFWIFPPDATNDKPLEQTDQRHLARSKISPTGEYTLQYFTAGRWK